MNDVVFIDAQILCVQLTQRACRITAPFFLCSLVKMSSGNSWMAARTHRYTHKYDDKHAFYLLPQNNYILQAAKHQHEQKWSESKDFKKSQNEKPLFWNAPSHLSTIPHSYSPACLHLRHRYAKSSAHSPKCTSAPKSDTGSECGSRFLFYFKVWEMTA